MAFGRDTFAKAAREISDHLMVVEHIAALQQAQKELANAIAALSDRLAAVTEVKVQTSESDREVLRELYNIVGGVQGSVNSLSTKVAIMEHAVATQTSAPPKDDI